jgi:hypothetical protein
VSTRCCPICIKLSRLVFSRHRPPWGTLLRWPGDVPQLLTGWSFPLLFAQPGLYGLSEVRIERLECTSRDGVSKPALPFQPQPQLRDTDGTVANCRGIPRGRGPDPHHHGQGAHAALQEPPDALGPRAFAHLQR